jgi:hypothetical protein
LKLLEENIGKALQDLVISNNFLHRTPIAQEIIARIDKWDCTAKGAITRVKREPTELEKKSLPATHLTGD